MLKKIYLIITLMFLTGCSLFNTNPYFSEGFIGDSFGISNNIRNSNISQLENENSFKIAMLLPLSGKMETLGQSMKKSAMLAINDLNNNDLLIQFYDTQSTSSGAMIAVENAIKSKPHLIIGPIMSEEVSAITNTALSKDIPVISFSTSPLVLQNGIYSLGLLNEEQIDKIIKHAAEIGRQNLAAVLPDNQSGTNMLKLMMTSSKNYGINLVKVGFYPPETMDFTQLVTQIAGEEKVKRSQMKAEDFEKLTEPLEPIVLDFDTLIIPEYGNKLKSIASMFSYYDIAIPEVLFMGTSIWANTNLSKETELYGATYPVMSFSRLTRFSQKYENMFEEKPNGLSIFAYDAIALSSALSHKDRNTVKDTITSIDGFYGMSGAFRIFDNGKNEHGLDIVKVTSKGPKVIEPAAKKFTNSNPSYAQFGLKPDYFNEMPIIYGKDVEELRNILINMD